MIKLRMTEGVNFNLYFQFGETLIRIGGDINVEIFEYDLILSILIYTKFREQYAKEKEWEKYGKNI